MNASTRRLTKELSDITTAASTKTFQKIKVDETNLLKWEGLIVPDKEPYSQGAFRITIDFPTEYPFKPPKVTFLTKIYHPNIDDDGQVCLPIIAADNWKPSTKTEQVIKALVRMVQEPEPDHPLRNELAEEFQKDRKVFNEKAQQHTKQYAEQRPE